MKKKLEQPSELHVVTQVVVNDRGGQKLSDPRKVSIAKRGGKSFPQVKHVRMGLKNKGYNQLAYGEGSGIRVSDFINVRDSLPDELKPYVMSYTEEEYKEKGVRLFLSKSKKSGYGIDKDGDLISVFSLPGAKEGKKAIINACKNGAKKLDCFDGKLPNFYKEFGFQEYDRQKWDDQYAPNGWDYKERGRPDIVLMSLKKKW